MRNCLNTSGWLEKRLLKGRTLLRRQASRPHGGTGNDSWSIIIPLESPQQGFRMLAYCDWLLPTLWGKVQSNLDANNTINGGKGERPSAWAEMPANNTSSNNKLVSSTTLPRQAGFKHDQMRPTPLPHNAQYLKNNIRIPRVSPDTNH